MTSFLLLVAVLVFLLVNICLRRREEKTFVPILDVMESDSLTSFEISERLHANNTPAAGGDGVVLPMLCRMEDLGLIVRVKDGARSRYETSPRGHQVLMKAELV